MCGNDKQQPNCTGDKDSFHRICEKKNDAEMLFIIQLNEKENAY